jgi:NAD(P)-dependent dehydrogenase (short-subunit alcohol dehydrogenase family)
VAPGFIATDMTHGLPEAAKTALLASIPLGRLGQAEEVAHAVAFLASPQGRLHHRHRTARQRRHGHELNGRLARQGHCIRCPPGR